MLKELVKGKAKDSVIQQAVDIDKLCPREVVTTTNLYTNTVFSDSDEHTKEIKFKQSKSDSQKLSSILKPRSSSNQRGLSPTDSENCGLTRGGSRVPYHQLHEVKSASRDMSKGSNDERSRSKSGNQLHYANNQNAAPLRILSRGNSKSNSRSRSREFVKSIKFEPMYASSKLSENKFD